MRKRRGGLVRHLGKRGRRKLTAFIAGLSALAIILLLASLNACMGRALSAVAEESVKEIAQKSLTEAVTALAAKAEEVAEDGLLAITKTGDESFVIIADTAKLNLIAAEAVGTAQSRLSELGRKGANIRLGTVTKIAFFTGAGPEIRVKFEPKGSVGARVVSRLTSAGVNQSLFSVDLIIEASLRVLTAGADRVIEIKTTVPVCQTVVVGKVPQVYTNVANEEDMLNLIPTELP